MDVEGFTWKPPEEYFLIVSELVPYKQVDMAVRASSRSGRRLKIAGGGPELRRLRRDGLQQRGIPGPRVRRRLQRDLYSRCRATFCWTGEEDFGISPVESTGQRQARDRAGPRRRFGNGSGGMEEQCSIARPAKPRSRQLCVSLKYWSRTYARRNYRLTRAVSSGSEFARKMAPISVFTGGGRKNPPFAR